MPEWLMWTLSAVAILVAVGWSYSISHIEQELRLIRDTLADIHYELAEIAEEASAMKRDRRESEMLALGIDPSD